MRNVRNCVCGREPEIYTCYEGMTPGWGPFIIKCSCGKYSMQFAYRSWYKTRAANGWNALIRNKKTNEEYDPYG